MTRSLWRLLSVAALVSAAACKDGGKDGDDPPPDTTPDEPDTFETSIPAPEVEAFSQLVQFGWDATLMQAVATDIDGNEVLPGIYMTLGEQAYFQGSSSAEVCDVQVVWEEPLDLAGWEGEVDALIAFQFAGDEATILTNCDQTDFEMADVEATIEGLTAGLYIGWAVADTLTNDVEDALDQFGEDPDEYFGGGFYYMDSEEFDDGGYTESGYAFGFVVNEDMEAEVDGDSLVPIDAADFTTQVDDPADTDAAGMVTTLATGFWRIGDIFFYTFN